MNSIRRLSFRPLTLASLPALLFAASIAFAQAPPAARPHTQLWRFDRTDSIGGYTTQVVGNPQVIETPYGKAVQFNGVDDGIFVPNHPLAGASTYTWEVIFRPDADGSQAQRFFHLQEQDPVTGADTGNRMLFEIRILDDGWCVDAFASSGSNSRTLLNCAKTYPLGQWARVTAVYDGKELRSYVNSDLQGEGSLTLVPHHPGHSSAGVRINKVFWFKGAILEARMTPRALPPSQFLKMPPKVVSKPTQ